MVRNLFLVDGASGTGKTDMVDYVNEAYGHRGIATILNKFTTRSRRNYEDEKVTLDLEFVEDEEFQSRIIASNCYSYQYSNKQYAFKKSDLDHALSIYRNVFIIIRDRTTIKRLVDDYPKIRVIPVYLYTDKDQIKQRLRSQSADENAIEFRLKRLDLAWRNYVQEPDLYKEILINNSTLTDFHRLIDNTIKKYSDEPLNILEVSACERFELIQSLWGFKGDLIARLNHFPYDNNVFLMMKFRDSNKLVAEFIKNQLNTHGFNCIRADDQHWEITRNVYNPLAVLYCCKYGIALFDEPEEHSFYNPNVAYELGMMHLQGKHCLILKHSNLPQVPFDLVKDLYVTYSKELELEQRIKEWVEKITWIEKNQKNITL